MNLASSVSLDQIGKLPIQLNELDKKFVHMDESIKKVDSTSNEILRKVNQYHQQVRHTPTLSEQERVVIEIEADNINQKISTSSMATIGLSFSLIVVIIAICTSVLIMLIPSIILGVSALVGISVSAYYLSKNLA